MYLKLLVDFTLKSWLDWQIWIVSTTSKLVFILEQWMLKKGKTVTMRVVTVTNNLLNNTGHLYTLLKCCPAIGLVSINMFVAQNMLPPNHSRNSIFFTFLSMWNFFTETWFHHYPEGLNTWCQPKLLLHSYICFQASEKYIQWVIYTAEHSKNKYSLKRWGKKVGIQGEQDREKDIKREGKNTQSCFLLGG